MDIVLESLHEFKMSMKINYQRTLNSSL